jgi:hypothetical protein
MGFKTKTLAIIGLVTAIVWAFAIHTGSTVFMIIIGVLTAILLGLLVWGWRMMRKQRGLATMLQGAAESPEARKAALAKLSASKDANNIEQIFVRASLLAQDEPQKALELLEAQGIKKFPAQLQDDVALLQSQLYLGLGRAKEARPLCDLVNLDAPGRQEQRGLMVAVVAQAWARTGKHVEAQALIDSVDLGNEKNAQIKQEILVARVFARFAAGKKGGAREDLGAIAAVDVNHLGRFIAPQMRVHPELVRLARQVAEKQPEVRRQAAKQMRGPRR